MTSNVVTHLIIFGKLLHCYIVMIIMMMYPTQSSGLVTNLQICSYGSCNQVNSEQGQDCLFKQSYMVDVEFGGSFALNL